MSLKTYLKNTKIYYLNINEREFVVFKKNMCHMTDIRGSKIDSA